MIACAPFNAGSDRGRLLVLGNTVEHDVKHVDLAVAGDDLTGWIDHDRRVEHPWVARSRLVDAAAMDVDPMTPRALRQQLGDRTRNRLRLVAVRVVRA